jgi:colicin import membrane protein
VAHAARAHDQLLPQPPGGLVPGAMLALAAHAAMLAALTLAVQWRTSAPEAVSAELWSAVPQVAAPPAPAPPPPAPPPPAPAPAPAPPPPKKAEAEPDAQIAIEQAKKARAEQDRQQRLREEREKTERERVQKAKAEQERQQREAEAKKREQQQREQEREKADERRLAELRKQQLERMMGQVGGSSSTSGGTPGGTAAVSSGPSASYAGRLIAAIKPNVVFTETVSGNAAAEVEVRAGPSGSILSRRLLRSSGNKDWDEAVLRAIDRTATLPRDTDGRVPAVILMAFRPNELN